MTEKFNGATEGIVRQSVTYLGGSDFVTGDIFEQFDNLYPIGKLPAPPTQPAAVALSSFAEAEVCTGNQHPGLQRAGNNVAEEFIGGQRREGGIEMLDHHAVGAIALEKRGTFIGQGEQTQRMTGIDHRARVRMKAENPERGLQTVGMTARHSDGLLVAAMDTVEGADADHRRR